MGLAILVVMLGDGGAAEPTTRAEARTASPRGATVYVGQNSCDDARPVADARDPATPWCSLKRALEAAGGSRVLVGPGRYPALEVDGDGQESAPVAFEAQFSGTRRPELAGVNLNRVQRVSFSGFRFTENAEIFNSSRIALTGNDFATAAIGVKSSRRVSVVGNRVHDIRGSTRAFLALGSADSSAPIEDLVVRDNRFEDIDHDAIAVYNANRHVLIEGNRIAHVRQPRNFPYHSDGIQLMGGTDVTVRGNVISDVTQGILVKDGDPSRRLTIERNLVTKVAGAGLQIFNAPRSVVDHNTVWGTRYGVILDNVTSLDARTSVALTANVLDSLLLRNGATVAAASGNVFRVGPAIGGSVQPGAPAFVNPSTLDLRIRSRSAPPGAQLRVE